MDSSKNIFSADRRDIAIQELSSREFDILVIGGGVTGAGIALDAATRGLSVALIEKADFASGTSSRSTKLIHGGLRYLKQMEFRLVRNVGIERAIVYKNAPHLVVPEKMMLPIFKGGTYGKFASRIGLWLYDKLAKVEKEDRRVMFNRDKTLEIEPLLKKNNLKGAGFYSEYRTDDARLTLELAKTASMNGAMMLNYCSAKAFINNGDQVIGVSAKDEFGDQQFEIKAKQIVNACGPWVDDVRSLNETVTGTKLALTKGVHLVVDRDKLPVNQSVYFDVEGGRMIFAIPRFDRTYIGTTDTFYSDSKEEPGVTRKDAEYLLNAVNKIFPEANLKIGDVLSTWSGLRPLIHEEGKSPSELSRKDEVFVSKNGLISIAGGKLTGYRLMAKKIVDLVCDKLQINQVCKTNEIVIAGGEFNHPKDVLGYIKTVQTRLPGNSRTEASILVRTFGKQTDDVLDLLKESAGNLVVAQALFCLRKEYSTKLTDFYVRRTGMMFFHPEKMKSSIELVADVFKNFLGWSLEKRNEEIDELLSLFEEGISFKAS